MSDVLLGKLRRAFADRQRSGLVTKKEREARTAEFLERGCPREFAEILAQAEEGIDRRQARIGRLLRVKHITLLRQAAELIEAFTTQPQARRLALMDEARVLLPKLKDACS